MQAPRLLSCKSSCWGKISPGSILQKDEGIPYHTAPRNPNIPAELGCALGSSLCGQPWSLGHPCDINISVHPVNISPHLTRLNEL